MNTMLALPMARMWSREREIEEYAPPIGTGRYSSTSGLKNNAVKIVLSASALVMALRRVMAAVRRIVASKNAMYRRLPCQMRNIASRVTTITGANSRILRSVMSGRARWVQSRSRQAPTRATAVW